MVGTPDFAEFYESEYPGLRRALSVALGDVGVAEEAAQEAFVKAWLRWRRVGRMERPVGWVYVVAVRHALRGRARELARVPVLDTNAAPGDDVADAVGDRLVANEALAGLAPRQRLAIVLRFHSDLSLAEIADAMACPIGTVKSTLHTALERLRVQINATEVADGIA